MQSRGGAADKLAKAEKELQDEAAAVRRSKYALDFVTRGLFFSELDKYSARKTVTLRSMLATFASAHIAYVAKLSKVWTGLIGELAVDPDEFKMKAKSTLQVLETDLTEDS